MPEIINYNPDVLTCLANLSSDEVFTPPGLANQMIDLLPKELFSNPDAKFLDPVSKSGVFLRELAKRLIAGLEEAIPDLQERINHVFTKQLYGLPITELTALLSRRSLYCSKSANGALSVCTAFDSAEGNVPYSRYEHTFKNGRCALCGANQEQYGRSELFENYAYPFLHAQTFQNLPEDMKFDVIIGNPPYQLSDGGGTGSSAVPLYHEFVKKAIALQPNHLIMIIPARWYSGGKGLDEFRNSILSDRRVERIVDFEDSRDCFPGVDISGGVCYFLWSKNYYGKCQVTNIKKSSIAQSERDLNEFSVFIRSSITVNIIHKVRAVHDKFLDLIVSPRNPFGLPSSFRGSTEGDLILISSAGESRVDRSKLSTGLNHIDSWRVLVSKASFDHGGQPDKNGRRKILAKVEKMPPGTVCTESYLILGPLKNESHADNLVLFLRTKFVRYLIGASLLTQNITRAKFEFVPFMDLDYVWDDARLFEYFKISEDEILHVENSIN